MGCYVFDVYIKIQDLENIWWILKEANEVYVYVIKAGGVCGCNPSDKFICSFAAALQKL